MPEHAGVEIGAGGVDAVVRSGLTPGLVAVIHRLLETTAEADGAAPGAGRHDG